VPWYQALANDPIALSGLNAGDSFGFTTGLGKTAAELARPEITQEAEVRNAPAKAYGEAVGKQQAGLDDPTPKPFYVSRDGSPPQRQMLTMRQAALMRQAGNDVEDGLNPEEQARETESGSLQGQIQYGREAQRQEGLGRGDTTTQKYDLPDGRTIEMTPSDYIMGRRAGQIPQAVGTSQAPQQAAYNLGDTKNLVSAQKTAPQEAAKARADRDSATAALSLVSSINPNAFTPTSKAFIDAANVLGLARSQANNLAMYKEEIARNQGAEAKQFGGRVSKADIDLAGQVSGGLTTPQDAASFMLARRIALANRQAAYQDGLSNYNGIGKHDYDRQFTQSANASSIYADPVFQTLKINGRPAVQILPKAPDGHVYGVLLPGSKTPKSFLVQ
jgi:hypothetical protein